MVKGATALEIELDRLYGLSLEEFIRARNEIAAALRKAGDTAGAAAVKALSKPSLSAWAVNQLVRRQADEMEALQSAGQRLLAAQQDALSGGGAEALRSAQREQRELVGTLRKAAAVLLQEGGHAATDATLDRIGATLQALSVASEPPDEGPARGRLSHDLDAPGFDVLAGLAAGPPIKARPRAAPERPPSRDADRSREDKEHVAEAEERVADASQKLKARRRDAAQAQASHERAAERARAARRELEEAERVADRARRRAAEAEEAATTAADEAEALAGRVTEAEEDVALAEQALKDAKIDGHSFRRAPLEHRTLFHPE